MRPPWTRGWRRWSGRWSPVPASGLTVAELLQRVPMDAGARELIACRIQVSYAHPVTLLAAERRAPRR